MTNAYVLIVTVLAIVASTLGLVSLTTVTADITYSEVEFAASLALWACFSFDRVLDWE